MCVADTFTCIFAGFVIFSFLGYMAGKMNLEVKDVAADGKFALVCSINVDIKTFILIQLNCEDSTI